MRSATKKKLAITEAILKFCKDRPKMPGEIANHININKHTLRANYLYPMKKKQLQRIMKAKRDTRYKS